MISVIMATYNGERFIKEQLTSILTQSLPPTEVIICDDNSDDNTVNILDAIKSNSNVIVNTFVNKVRVGVKENFSKALALSKEKYIALSDQDDYWLPNKLELSYNLMKKLELIHGEETPILVFTNLSLTDEKLNVLKQSMWKYTNINPNYTHINNLILNPVVTGCTIFMNRALAEKIGNIPKECLMHDAWISLVGSVYGVIDFIEQPTVLYRQHSNNVVGAAVIGIIERIKKYFLRDYNIEPFYKQIICFYEKYRNDMPEESIIIINNFIKTYKTNFLKQRFYLLKYSFLEGSFRRKLIRLILLK